MHIKEKIDALVKELIIDLRLRIKEGDIPQVDWEKIDSMWGQIIKDEIYPPQVPMLTAPIKVHRFTPWKNEELDGIRTSIFGWYGAQIGGTSGDGCTFIGCDARRALCTIDNLKKENENLKHQLEGFKK